MQTVPSGCPEVCFICAQDKEWKQKGKDSSVQVVVGQKVSDESKGQTEAGKVRPHVFNVVQPSVKFPACRQKTLETEDLISVTSRQRTHVEPFVFK